MTSNYVDETGLHLQALTDIVTELEDGFKTIYGSSINLNPNSPDGQMINLFAQAKIDMLDLVSQVYGSFSPTSAIGVALDQRCAINGVIRAGATYTTTNITVTTDRILSLVGQSSGAVTPFTVSDALGNNFYLADNETLGVGPNVLSFISAIAGAVLTTTNTITNIVTITLGVISVNNPSSVTIQGVDEETDAALRLRRSKSVALPSLGYLDGLTGSLLAIPDVLDALVVENATGTTDGNSIPAHSIWSIVDGGDHDIIADVIYKKRNAGCGMYGNVTVSVPQINNINFPVKFSNPTYEDLYVTMVLTSLSTLHVIDAAQIIYIKQSLFDGKQYKIYEIADFTALSVLLKSIDPLAVIVSGGVCKTVGGTYVPLLATTGINYRFIMSTSKMIITAV
jgi:uncharacterized phage protein gp47/JayE